MFIANVITAAENLECNLAKAKTNPSALNEMHHQYLLSLFSQITEIAQSKMKTYTPSMI